MCGDAEDNYKLLNNNQKIFKTALISLKQDSFIIFVIQTIFSNA